MFVPTVKRENNNLAITFDLNSFSLEKYLTDVMLKIGKVSQKDFHCVLTSMG